ncbi:MAG: aminotransferase class V-fold PLP-dependent enzyme [Chitinophagales bacterium]|nr:aminotransferase class V-fold PLP-dependent enzyme [Chitinophagales bacterium]
MQNELTKEELKVYFPQIIKYNYLNTPASGLLPQPVLQWRHNRDEAFVDNPNDFMNGAKDFLQSVKETIAQFFDVQTKDIALVPNFSYSINMILEGLVKKQKILLLKEDYPSVNWPVESRDFEIHYIEVNQDLEQNIRTAIEREKMDIFIFSNVQWLSGMKLDKEFLKELKNDFPYLLLIADGTQYLGTEQFSFKESPIDVMATSAYKWLTSAFGCGFLMIKESVRDRILPKTIGFNSSENFADKPGEESYMKRFEPGHQDTLTLGSIKASLLFMQTLGENRIYEQVKHISIVAKEIFSALGIIDETIMFRKNYSSIYNLHLNETTFDKLIANHLICSWRGGGIRVGLHYYNDENDIDKLIELIK